MRKHSRTGSFFFVLDVFIAASILVLSLIVIYSSRVNVPDTSQSYTIAEDFMTFVTTTTVGDLTHPYRTQLTADGNISDLTYLLHQQIAKMYWNRTHDPAPIQASSTQVAKLFVQSISIGIIPEQYGFSYSVNETVIYNRSNNTRATATLHLVARKMTFLKVDEEIFVGPINTTIEVWN